MKKFSVYFVLLTFSLAFGLSFMSCGGGGSNKESPASDFTYVRMQGGDRIGITRYNGNGGKVVIPSVIEDLPVTVIGNNAFAGQDDNQYFPANNITEIVIPNSVVTIGMNAFYWNDNLRSVTLPNGLKDLPSNAFASCENLTTVNLPESLERIGALAFYECGKLANLTIPSSLTGITFSEFMGINSAFDGCQKLPNRTRQRLQELGYTGSF